LSLELYAKQLSTLFNDISAALVYWPLALLSASLDKLHFQVHGIPLPSSLDHIFCTMRKGACDRFCTPLQKSFTRAQIKSKMREADLVCVEFWKMRRLGSWLS